MAVDQYIAVMIRDRNNCRATDVTGKFDNVPAEPTIVGRFVRWGVFARLQSWTRNCGQIHEIK